MRLIILKANSSSVVNRDDFGRQRGAITRVATIDSRYSRTAPPTWFSARGSISHGAVSPTWRCYPRCFTFRVTVYGVDELVFHALNNNKGKGIIHFCCCFGLFQNLQDSEAEKAIMGSIVYCIHHKDGCKWSDELRKLKVRSLS